MITQSNFKNVLSNLEFVESENVFTKRFDNFELKADFTRGTLIYPENAGFKINERQTCNFSANENFVVFECVNRLFEKGYLPKHIELEPKWKLGRGASGGRADIWVKDNNNNSLLIIECKTTGKEFEDAWKDTLEDGGQLFSYFQQEKSTQFVALYASDFANNETTCDYRLIAVRDNEEHLKSFGKREVPSFAKADTVKKIYKAWVETYQKDFSTRGLFEKDIAAYTIGKNKYSIDDLKEVNSTDIQKKYHEFATILRQHNVSGHENAFDKLVNLFLAKIVDEDNYKNEKNELAFYWKGTAYDDIFSLVDRLQKLYKSGMKRFLKETVTYVGTEDIDRAFDLHKKDAVKVEILKYFRQLKYFSNNDFAFIDVHNEKLFYQNAEVLLKIVQMLQDIKLQTETQNQFLGDLFEGFLDKGVKQSEGQFFTPMPIVKFLISALPLEKIITENAEIPQVIDYACGAGHFLNEYAHQITPIVPKENKNIKEYYAKITGIEKEYRLSKVAKVSAFMYEQGEINIMYADALQKNTELKEGAFSILVANPPYSVKGFLETIPEDRKNYDLFDEKTINVAKNNSIECFFVERAKQLLKSGGVAAIILPSSILNNGNIYIRMREILLKYFDIVAIAEFGSGTFGKTGTNTATLFLRKKDDKPPLAKHFKNCVDEWFSGNLDYTKPYKIPPTEWIDAYCEKINVSTEDYKTLLIGKPNDSLLQTEIFVEYKNTFDEKVNKPKHSSETAKEIYQKTRNIRKKQLNTKYTQENKDRELSKLWIDYLKESESEKLYYFLLCENQQNPVVLMKSPADKKEHKKFLGYEWSDTKGNEGIKYLNTADKSKKIKKEGNNDIEIDDRDEYVIEQIINGINQIQTPLFNPNNLEDESKINTLIRNNFIGKFNKSNESEFITFANLSDMIDFSRVSFDKAIKTTPEKKIEIVSKYELVKLGDVCSFISKGKRPASFATENGTIPFVISSIQTKKCDEADFNQEAMIIGDGGMANVHYFNGEFSASDHTYIVENKDKTKNNLQYIYNFLNENLEIIETGFSGIAIKNVAKKYLEEIKIPLPPLDIQKQIIAKCEEIDREYNTSRITMDEYKNKIAKIFENLEVITEGEGGYIYTAQLKDLCKSINPSKAEIKDVKNNTNVSFVEMASISNNGHIETKIDRPLGELRKSGYTYFAENDIIIAKITPCMENGKCAIATGLTNGLGMGSSEFHIFRAGEKIDNRYLFGFLNREIIRREAEKRMTGASGHRRVPISYYENLQIPVPPLAEQQKIVSQIEEYESKIEECQKIMEKAHEKKKAILQSYL